MKNKFLSFVLAFVMVIGIMPVMEVSAAVTKNEPCGENLTWTLDNEGTLTISGTGDMYDYDGISLETPWNDLQDDIINVIIEDGVTSIGEFAIASCYNLTEVTIPDSVTDIGNGAFAGCWSLLKINISEGNPNYSLDEYGVLFNKKKTELVQFPTGSTITVYKIPETVKSIGYRAFEWCYGLTEVTIPDSVTSVGDGAFMCCGNLTKAEIPNNVTNIGDYAFRECTSLTEVIIPDNVTNIGYGAFQNCEDLVSLTIGKRVTSIGDHAFLGCNSLTEVTIPDTVESIGVCAFYSCHGLKSLTIGKGVKKIGINAFSYCDSVTDVFYKGTNIQWYRVKIDGGNEILTNASVYNADGVIPPPEILEEGTCGENLAWTFDNSGKLTVSGTGDMDEYWSSSTPWDEFADDIYSVDIKSGVTSIGDYAFLDCDTLTEVTICDTVTCIGYIAFSGCRSLTEISVSEENEYYSSDEYGALFSKYKSELIQYPVGNARKTYTIPDGVTNIDESAFAYCSSLTEVIIPDTVTVIGYAAFSGCNSLTEVTIPDTVEDIGWGAFEGCGSLSEITIPDGITSIGYNTFYGCSSLIKITIPDSVTSIEYSAFDGCDNITDVYYGGTEEQWNEIAPSHLNFATVHYEYDAILPTPTPCPEILEEGTCGENLTWTLDSNGTLTISGTGDMDDYDSYDYSGMKAPWYYSSIKNVIIEDGVTSIGEYAFYRCDSLTEVTIGNDVKSISDYAFYGCPNLRSVKIGDSLADIGVVAFWNCNNFAEINVSENNPNYSSDEYGVLFNKDKTELIKFPEGNTETEYIIPYSVKSIADYAFDYTSNLTKLTILSGVTSIADCAFLNCESLSEVGVSKDNPNYSSDEYGVLFNKDKTQLILYPDGNTRETYIIPNGVTGIGYAAFKGCDNLTKVTIPDSVTRISKSAFEYCYGLTEVTIPDSVTDIEKYAFCYCDSVVSLTIGEGVTNIGYGAFEYCKGLTEVVIPDSVTTIGGDAFEHCEDLVSLTIGKGVTTIEGYAFRDCDSLKNVCYRGTDVEWTKVVIGYGNYCLTDATIHYAGGIVTPPDVLNPAMCGTSLTWGLDRNGTLTIYGVGAMYNYKACSDVPWYDSRGDIKKVVIEDSVTSIGDYAFYYCYDLVEVTIPDGVTSIGDYAFYDCDSVVSLTIGEGVTSIGDYAFEYCSKLSDIAIPDSVKSIGKSAFEWCHSLTEVTIPGGVTSIGDYAFCDCGSLTKITIPGSVTSIGERVFERCDSLTEINVSENNLNYSSDEYGVLFNKDKTELIQYPTGNTRTEYMIPDSVESIRNYAFGFCTDLMSVTIPDSVIDIEICAFGWCDNIAEINVSEDNPNYSSDGYGVLFNKDKTELIQYPTGNTRTSYKIPEGVATIGKEAFVDCTYLNIITIPDSITNIANRAFYACDRLMKINVSEGNLNYSTDTDGTLFNKDKTELVFRPIGNRDVKYYKIPDGVTSIAPWAFANSYSLESVTIPDGVTNIGDKAFSFCNMATMVIPDSVTSIEYGAFNGCDNITDVYYGGTEEQWNEIEIGENNDEFVDATIHYEYDSTLPIPTPTPSPEILKEGTCGENLTWTLDSNGTLTISGTGDMDDYATINDVPWNWYRYRIKSVVICEGVTVIGKNVLAGCNSLTEVAIPDSVTGIGRYALGYCDNLSSVTMGSGVASIDEYAFWQSNNIVEIAVPEDNPNYSSDEYGVLFNKDKTELIKYPSGNAREAYTISDSVTSIGKRAFDVCDNLIKINVSEGNQSYSSDECGVLFNKDKTRLIRFTTGNITQNYDIPDSVTSISGSAFYDCDSLCTLRIGENVATIDRGAIQFCRSLKEINVSEGNPNYSSDEYGVLFNKDKTKLIQYPIGKVKAEYIVPDGVTSIEGGAFNFCDYLVAVTIPGSVKSIGNVVFSTCDKLTDIYYKGTERQWDKIEIGTTNDSLTDATIHYEPEPVLQELSVEKTGEDANITVSVFGTYDDASVYVVSYDERGKLLEIKAPEILNGIANATLSSVGVDNYKAFLWGSEFSPLGMFKESK